MEPTLADLVAARDELERQFNLATRMIKRIEFREEEALKAGNDEQLSRLQEEHRMMFEEANEAKMSMFFIQDKINKRLFSLLLDEGYAPSK